MDLTHGPSVTQVVTQLGYPVYILTIIGMLKVPGAIAIVVPGFLRLKEWAHAGIVFELLGAVASQAACRNWANIFLPLSLLCVAMASWALRPADRRLR